MSYDISTAAGSHCMRCLTPAPKAPRPSGWGVMLIDAPNGDKFFVAICPDCDDAVERWICGEHDEVLGNLPEPQQNS